MEDLTFKSELVGAQVRRVVIELPVERALTLARVIDEEISWSDTAAEYELAALHEALDPVEG